MSILQQFLIKKDDQSPLKKDSDLFSKFLMEEIKVTANTLPSFENINIDKRFDSNSHAGFYLAQTLFKTVISETHLTHLTFGLELFTFLKDKGTLLYRRVLEDEVSYFFLYKDLIVSVSAIDNFKPEITISGISTFHSIKTNPFPKELNEFIIKPKNTPKIGLIKTNQYGPFVSWVDMNSDQKFSYDYYNDDFSNFVDDLKVKITKEKTGLYLFHGEPGTGKSSFIRHIVSEIDRQFVFVPPQMVHCLSSPDFTNLVTSHLKDTVLIIEDAEKALMTRTSEDAFHNSELVSSILNLTDGLYADMAGISIVATYNCERNLIDPALLRKGRLKSEYQFKKLSIEKSQSLMDSLGFDVSVNEEMSLADIFNHEAQFTNNKVEKKRQVGFGR